MRERLKDVIAEKGYNYITLAEEIGYSRQTLSAYIRGIRPMPYLVRAKLTKLLHVDVDALLEKERLQAKERKQVAEEARSYFDNDLTLQLQAIAFKDLTFAERLQRIARTLQRFSHISPEERREALLRLISFPFALEEGSMTTVKYGDYLMQTSTSIAACWKLVTSSQTKEDMLAAYNGATAFLPSLVNIAEQSSEHRKQALSLAAQCSLIKSFLSWHLQNLIEASANCEQAYLYSNNAGDSVLVSCALDTQAWANYYSSKDKQALDAAEKTIPYMKAAEVPQMLRSGLQSALCVMRARNGIISTDTYKQAIDSVDADMPADQDYYTYSEICTNGVLMYYEQQDYDTALKTGLQLINENDLQTKIPMTERERVMILNYMALSALKGKRRDRDRAVRFWEAAIQGARDLESEQRFRESITVYQIMDTLWKDKAIKELRELTRHW